MKNIYSIFIHQFMYLLIENKTNLPTPAIPIANPCRHRGMHINGTRFSQGMAAQATPCSKQTIAISSSGQIRSKRGVARNNPARTPTAWDINTYADSCTSVLVI